MTGVSTDAGSEGHLRIGQPDLAGPNTANRNGNVASANSRVSANAGTNLAGGSGLFAGADGYEVSGNDICGNFSLEWQASSACRGSNLTRGRVVSACFRSARNRFAASRTHLPTFRPCVSLAASLA